MKDKLVPRLSSLEIMHNPFAVKKKAKGKKGKGKKK
jgi:hypothetical protein